MFMKRSAILIIVCCLLNSVKAQEQNANTALGPGPAYTVQAHKEQLRLTIMIDSVHIANKTEKLNFQRTLDISFESDYLQIKDDIHIKIFIARNQEYGKKFYSWKWEYLKKTGESYTSLGAGYYEPVRYNRPLATNTTYGQGIGNEGESGHLMFYYRYKLE